MASKYPPPPPLPSSSGVQNVSSIGVGSSRARTQHGPTADRNPSRSTRTKPTEPLLDYGELDRREFELRRRKKSKWAVPVGNTIDTTVSKGIQANQIALPPSTGDESSQRGSGPNRESSRSIGAVSKSSKSDLK